MMKITQEKYKCKYYKQNVSCFGEIYNQPYLYLKACFERIQRQKSNFCSFPNIYLESN